MMMKANSQHANNKSSRLSLAFAESLYELIDSQMKSFAKEYSNSRAKLMVGGQI